ncbi:MAG: NUDIX hydrolase [Pseudolabrys sp.]|jgi:hypothetical protein|nr:NUDIX hydrolase [Pseudolabrys sp.]
MKVLHADALDFRFEPRRWAFADDRRVEIDAHFAETQRANPRLWNGRVLILNDWSLNAGIASGTFLETDYASFRAWLDWGRPDAGVMDCFASAVVVASDGAFLLGEMAAHTANAGRVYFPCGTPGLEDVRGGKVDLAYSLGRELREETGLDIAQFSDEPGWTVIEGRSRLVVFKIVRAPWPGEELKACVLRFLQDGGDDELAAIHLVRGPEDLAPSMPDYVAAFFRARWI